MNSLAASTIWAFVLFIEMVGVSILDVIVNGTASRTAIVSDASWSTSTAALFLAWLGFKCFARTRRNVDTCLSHHYHTTGEGNTYCNFKRKCEPISTVYISAMSSVFRTFHSLDFKLKQDEKELLSLLTQYHKDHKPNNKKSFLNWLRPKSHP